jgi:hypothetical protein
MLAFIIAAFHRLTPVAISCSPLRGQSRRRRPGVITTRRDIHEHPELGYFLQPAARAPAAVGGCRE